MQKLNQLNCYCKWERNAILSRLLEQIVIRNATSKENYFFHEFEKKLVAWNHVGPTLVKPDTWKRTIGITLVYAGIVGLRMLG